MVTTMTPTEIYTSVQLTMTYIRHSFISYMMYIDHLHILNNFPQWLFYVDRFQCLYYYTYRHASAVEEMVVPVGRGAVAKAPHGSSSWGVVERHLAAGYGH